MATPMTASAKPVWTSESACQTHLFILAMRVTKAAAPDADCPDARWR
ncbi:MAG: hypothetical protein MK160_12340 [Rhodobacteraceae bacterium]|nr:hypothetical protein [Paracoccaceae bacterium]